MSPAEGALVAAAISGIVALITARLTLRAAETRLRAEFKLQFAAEEVVHELLSDKRWTLRSFDIIRRHIGGFKDDELRQVLVRAGAIRFEGKLGGELWGLLHRNRDRLGATLVDQDPTCPPEVGVAAQG